MALLWKNILGVFVIDSGEIKEEMLFSKNPSDVADKLIEECEEERKFKEEYENLKSGHPDISIEEISEKYDIFENKEALRNFTRDVAAEYTDIKIEESKGKDKNLIESVKALEELKDTENKLMERLESWSDIYSCDKDRLLQSIEELDEKEGTSELKSFASLVAETRETEERIESYIEKTSKKVAPNLTALLDPLLTARILALAGSLEKLAKMPSSTVQVLGAEKALFRYMKGEGSAPKHGVIFLHPCVNQAPNDKRGKVARFLSNKISIAARLDFYGDKDKGEKLRKEVEDKLEEVRG